ncbi:MAG: hypothetical protein COC09_09730 [Gammaproteobacteria bacterium]|nr:hypothetical protein [Gammaproteobacteria bacterium]PCH62045.1 MAG: hypothetical protein COC09_09730 [Gammaproteobacteria bacterium]
MKNIALIAAIIGASSSAFVQAHDFGSSNNDATVSVVSSNLGRIHGYTIPFNKSVEAASKGQYADVGQFGRISAYGNAINRAYEVSKGVYANIGQYGRLGGYGETTIVVETTTIASH